MTINLQQNKLIDQTRKLFLALCEVKSFEVLLDKLYAALAHELSLLESEETSSLLVTNAVILVTSQVNLK